MENPEPKHCRKQAYDLFLTQLTQLNQADALMKAAVAVAMHELPEVDPEKVAERIHELGDTVRARVRGDNPRALIAHLHEVLFEEEGFTGNTRDYYNPRNSYLPVVLETRQGLPITLTLIYKLVAERVGLTVYGINAPGHFLAAVELQEGRVLIDPFARGRLLVGEEVYARIEQSTGMPVERSEELIHVATPRQWLARMLQNLQNIFARLGRSNDLAAMLELRNLLFPDAPKII